MKKYTVIVRIKVHGSKHSVLGRSGYDEKSRQTKFNSAILNAVYTDRHDRHIPFKTGDSLPKYEIVNSSIAYAGREQQPFKKGEVKQLNSKVKNKNKKFVSNISDESQSKSSQQTELYGGENVKKERVVHMSEDEYQQFKAWENKKRIK